MAKEIILEVGAEGGSLTISGEMSAAGTGSSGRRRTRLRWMNYSTRRISADWEILSTRANSRSTCANYLPPGTIALRIDYSFDVTGS